MTLEKIEIKNFKSYRGNFLIGPFYRFTSIIGPNGSGKSNILDSIMFVLNLPIKSLRVNSLMDLISYDEDECYVRIYIMCDIFERRLRRKDDVCVCGYFYNGNKIGQKEYNVLIEGIGILNRIKNFVICQGDVLTTEVNLLNMLEFVCGNENVVSEYEDIERQMRIKSKELCGVFNRRKDLVGYIEDMKVGKAREIEFQRLVKEKDEVEMMIKVCEADDKRRRILAIDAEIARLRESSVIGEYNKKYAEIEKIRNIAARLQKECFEVENELFYMRNYEENNEKYLASKNDELEEMHKEFSVLHIKILSKVKMLSEIIRNDQKTSNNINDKVNQNILIDKSDQKASNNINDKVNQNILIDKSDQKASNNINDKVNQNILTTKSDQKTSNNINDKVNQNILTTKSDQEPVNYQEIIDSDDLKGIMKNVLKENLSIQDKIRNINLFMKKIEENINKICDAVECKENEVNLACKDDDRILNEMVVRNFDRLKERNDLLNRIKFLRKKIKEIDECINERKKKENEKNIRINALEKEAMGLHARIETKERIYDELVEDERKKEEEISGITKEILLNKAKKYEASRDGIKNSVISNLRNIYSGVHGKVIDFIKPTQKRYEVAISVLLGSNAYAVIVDNENTAFECIKYIKELKCGKMTFLPLSRIKGSHGINNIIRKKDKGCKDYNFEENSNKDSFNTNEETRNTIGSFKKEFLNKNEGNYIFDRTIRACDCVNYDDKYAGIVEYFLGGALLVELEEIAGELLYRRAYGHNICTIDGTLFTPGGVITGGREKRNRFDENIFEQMITRRNAVLKELNLIKERKEAFSDVKFIKDRLAEIQAEITKLTAVEECPELVPQLAKYRHELTDNENRLLIYDEELKEYEGAKKRMSESRKNKERELLLPLLRTIGISSLSDYKIVRDVVVGLRTMVASLNIIGEDIVNIRDKYFNKNNVRSRDNMLNGNAVDKENILKDKFKNIAKELERVKEELRVSNDRLSDLNKKKNNIQAKIMANEMNKARIEEELREIELEGLTDFKLINTGKEDINDYNKNSNNNDYNKNSNNNDYNKNSNNNDYNKNSNNNIDNINDNNKNSNNNIDNINDNNKNSNNNIDNINDNNKNSNNNDYNKNSNNNIDNINDYNKNNTLYTKYSLDDLKNKLNEINSKIQENIPTGGYVEDSFISKFESIDKEYRELKDAVAALKKTFYEVKAKRMETFRNCFTIVSEHLVAIYRSLTRHNGIEGNAYLVYEGDPFVNNLKYYVMPPCGKFTEFKHLSGGERSMALLAFIFALNKYKQAPFYIFDEVDAALDRSNVEKLTAYFSQSTDQLVVITLKHRVFQESNALIGVYKCPQTNSSKILSCKLE